MSDHVGEGLHSDAEGRGNYAGPVVARGTELLYVDVLHPTATDHQRLGKAPKRCELWIGDPPPAKTALTIPGSAPVLARHVFADLLQELHFLDEQIQRYDRQLQELAGQSEPARRVMAIEGIGPITATAFAASVGDAQVFKSGQFAAWLGLTLADGYSDPYP